MVVRVADTDVCQTRDSGHRRCTAAARIVRNDTGAHPCTAAPRPLAVSMASRLDIESTPIGTHRWDPLAAAPFSPDNTVDITQVPPTYGGRALLWQCPRGHVWEESARSRNQTEKLPKWRVEFGRLACRHCVMDDFGPEHECGHLMQDPLERRLLAEVRRERLRFDGLCSSCAQPPYLLVPPYACGRLRSRADLADETGSMRPCDDCEETERLLADRPELAARAEAAGSHWTRGHLKIWYRCGVASHAPFRMTRASIARGYWCAECWAAEHPVTLTA